MCVLRSQAVGAGGAGPTDIGRHIFEEIPDLDGPVMAEVVGLAGSSEGQLPGVILNEFCNAKGTICPVHVGNYDAAPVICKGRRRDWARGERN